MTIANVTRARGKGAITFTRRGRRQSKWCIFWNATIRQPPRVIVRNRSGWRVSFLVAMSRRENP